MRRKWLVLLGLCLPLCAVAGGSVTGTVASVLVRQSDGLTYVYINGTATGKPACATNIYWMISAETSDAGKRLYALLLSAKVAEMTVIIVVRERALVGLMEKTFSRCNWLDRLTKTIQGVKREHKKVGDSLFGFCYDMVFTGAG